MSSQPRTIVIEIKNVYGELKAYPACSQSRIFAEIAGTKVLTHYTLTQIEALGYEITQSHRTVDLKKVA